MTSNTNAEDPAPPESEPTAALTESAVPESELPSWAQQGIRRRRLLSPRNYIIAAVAVVVIGFVVWLNFPFIPDPIILLTRQPDRSFDSNSVGDNWLMAGRNTDLTQYVPDALTPPEGQLAWSVNRGPATLAAPAIDGQLIYLGGHFRIAILDAANGAEVGSIPTTGPLGNSIALADGKIFYAMPDRRLVARDAVTFEQLWEYEMGDSTSGPVSVARGIVYAGALDGVTYAVNATTGELVWQRQSLKEVRSPVAVSDKVAYVASADRSLYALDARTGQERSRFRTQASLVAPPVAANGLVYFVSGGKMHAMDGAALEFPGRYAVTRVWSQLWLWGFPMPAPPAQPGDRWRFVPEVKKIATEGIISAPAVAGEDFYVGDISGQLYAGDAQNGVESWRFIAADGIVASPLVVGDAVIFGDKAGWIYSLNREDGSQNWRLQLPAAVRTAPVYANGRLYVRTEDGALHAIE